MELIFVRHGLPERDETSADPPLSDLGHQQARRVADFLKQERIDHIIASTMVRAHQTAEPLAEALGMDIELRDDIREADEHSGSYIPAEEWAPDSKLVQQLRDDPHFLFKDHGGWEPWKKRVVGAVDDIVEHNRGKRVAVFCHGLVMATFLCSMIDSDQPLEYAADYTSLFRVKANSTGLRTLTSWNETVHVRDLLS